MQETDEYIQRQNKELLLKTLGNIVHNKRKAINKGINKFSFEYDIGNGLLSRLESGKIDTKITTLWKLANAFNIKCSDLIKLVEAELGEDFNFYN